MRCGPTLRAHRPVPRRTNQAKAVPLALTLWLQLNPNAAFIRYCAAAKQVSVKNSRRPKYSLRSYANDLGDGYALHLHKVCLVGCAGVAGCWMLPKLCVVNCAAIIGQVCPLQMQCGLDLLLATPESRAPPMRSRQLHLPTASRPFLVLLVSSFGSWFQLLYDERIGRAKKGRALRPPWYFGSSDRTKIRLLNRTGDSDSPDYCSLGAT